MTKNFIQNFTERMANKQFGAAFAQRLERKISTDPDIMLRWNPSRYVPRGISLTDPITLKGWNSDEREMLLDPLQLVNTRAHAALDGASVDDNPTTPAELVAETLSVTFAAVAGKTQYVNGIMLCVTTPRDQPVATTLTITKAIAGDEATHTETVQLSVKGDVTDGIAFVLFSEPRANGRRVFSPAVLREDQSGTQSTALDLVDRTLVVGLGSLPTDAVVKVYPLFSIDSNPLMLTALFAPEDINFLMNGDHFEFLERMFG